MPIGTNLPVQSIIDLAATVKSQSAKVMGELASLRSACQRDPNFTGTAASRYDEYMQQWDVHQKALAENLDGAGQLLQSFADRIADLDGVPSFDI